MRSHAFKFAIVERTTVKGLQKHLVELTHTERSDLESRVYSTYIFEVQDLRLRCRRRREIAITHGPQEQQRFCKDTARS